MATHSASGTHDHGAPTVPRAVLLGAGALVTLTLCAAGAARIWHWHAATPAPMNPVHTVHIRFLDRADGAVEVRDADRANRLISEIAPGTNGFLRGVMRGLARGRRAEHVSPEVPFTLTHWADGEMTLTDPATGQRLSLEVFGQDNARAFANLLTEEHP